MNAPKYYIFDMDGTLTESREMMTQEMFEAFRRLCYIAPVIVISGATSVQMDDQIPFRSLWYNQTVNLWKMSQNGNVCEKDNRIIWQRQLSDWQKSCIYSHIHKVMMAKLHYGLFDSKDLVQDRGCQVSLSLVGHNAEREKKNAFDPDGAKRRNILNSIPFDEWSSLTVKVGGSTCLDYVDSKGTKGENLKRLIPNDLSNAIYVGDQLYDSGNDSDVKEYISEVVPVKGPEDTFRAIEGFLSH